MKRARGDATREPGRDGMQHAIEPTRRPAAIRPRSGELPGIAAALADPVIRRMMQADGVDPEELERTLRGMARKLARRGREA